VTVREMVTAIRVEVREGGLTPIRAGELATELSSLLGNIAEEITDADMAYNAVYAQHLDTEGKANRARIRAELTPEYLRKRQAHDTHLVAVEMMRSLRKLQDTFREEMRLAR
jgi:hypothetical protein